MSEAHGYRTFDTFQVGALIGETAVAVEPSLQAAWQRIDGPVDDARLPPGLLVALLMRGYSQVVDRRPPGNVHAGLTLEFLDNRLSDDTLHVSVRCAGKKLRGERRWVDFDAEQWSGGRCMTRARLTLLWAR